MKPTIKSLIQEAVQEALTLQNDRENNALVVVSNETDAKKASQETFRNKETLKSGGFRWSGDIKAWTIPIERFEDAKKMLADINKSEEFVDQIESLEEFVRNAENFQGKNDLMGRIHLYIEDLANATDERAMSAEIRRYLTFFASFRGHSFFNTLLIWLQNQNATKVAGFRQWEKKFRRVKKGAKGLMIFVPIFSKPETEKDDETGLDKEVRKGRAVRFRPGYVFDIADTEAIDERGNVPDQPQWFHESEPTERTRQLYGYLKEVISTIGITMTSDAPIGQEKGYSKGNHINMSSAIEGAGEVATLVHELAHELMHWKKSSLYYQGDEVKYSSALKELQAESVSYIVMKHYDLPVQHQPTYLALWKANKEAILAQMKSISEVARFIIEEIDKVAAQQQGMAVANAAE